MPYSISGTTISVSGTVDLMNVSLPPIYRINFAAGGTTATFNAYNFMYVPPPGVYFTVVGSASHDVLTIDVGFLSSIDSMTFFSFVNWSANDVVVLKGNSDRNYLSGSYARDILLGGNGDDTYHIGPGDIVDETGTDGVDTIISYSSVSLLSPNIRGDVENVFLTGENASATGNALANRLTGTEKDNILNGLTGDDVMQGKAGNDTYVVDTLNDIVDEAANNPGGVDRILSYVSYTLLDTVHVKGAVENLVLIGAALEAEGNGYNNAITGNGLANTIEGLAGNDVLNGAAGADLLYGGAGNDTYVLGSEASGVDKVVDSSGSADGITSLVNRYLSFGDYSDVENLVLLGNAVSAGGNGLSNVLTGNARVNALTGLGGNDKLVGGVGADGLTGGVGADQFIFNDVGESRKGSGYDFIVDFSHAQNDKVVLSAIDANTKVGGNQAFNFISSTTFSKKAGELRYEKAGGHSYILGDIDGDGVADLVIVSGLPVNFVRSDFLL